MWELTKKYWLEFGFGLLAALYAWIWGKLKARYREQKYLKSAITALLRDRVVGIYNRYEEKGYFPIYERENLEHLTKEYYRLGGNGVVRDLEQKLLGLPVGKGGKQEDTHSADA